MSLREWGNRDLPNGWVVAQLHEFVSTRSGNSKLIKGKLHKEPTSELFQAYSASGANVWTDVYEYEAEGIVVSAVGARCGKSFFAKGKWTAIANTHVVIPNVAGLDSRLLWYGLNDEDFWIKSGSAQPFVVVSKSLARGFGVPPRAEQARIVQKLDELLSDLDAGVAELKVAQRKLTQYRQSLLKAAVEGALTADWRAARAQTGEPQETGAELLQRILVERRAGWEASQLAHFAEQSKTPPNGWHAKYKEPVAPDTTELPALPQGWSWASLDALVAESSYGTSGKCSYESVETPVLRIPNVSAGKLDLRNMKHSIQPLTVNEDAYLTTGDILVIRTNGSVGLVGRAAAVTAELPVPHYFASYLLRLRCVDRVCSHRWIAAVLAAPSGRRWLELRAASSAGQHNISLSTLLTMPVPLPPTTEQARALDLLEISIELCDEQEEAVNRSLKQSAAQRRNILKAAFAGQLVPQDPNDEPASVLLELIRAERETSGKTTTRGRKPRTTA